MIKWGSKDEQKICLRNYSAHFLDQGCMHRCQVTKEGGDKNTDFWRNQRLEHRVVKSIKWREKRSEKGWRVLKSLGVFLGLLYGLRNLGLCGHAEQSIRIRMKEKEEKEANKPKKAGGGNAIWKTSRTQWIVISRRQHKTISCWVRKIWRNVTKEMRTPAGGSVPCADFVRFLFFADFCSGSERRHPRTLGRPSPHRRLTWAGALREGSRPSKSTGIFAGRWHGVAWGAGGSFEVSFASFAFALWFAGVRSFELLVFHYSEKKHSQQNVII